MDNNSNGSSVEGDSRGARKFLRLSQLSCENDSKNCPDLVQECQKTEHDIPKWTNEKHSSYLKSLETSFVNQLYDSMDNLGWQSRRECVSEQKHSILATPSGQYKVFQDGSWTRINFRRERPQPKQTYQSDDILSNPWIQHYRLQCSKGSTVTNDQTNIEGNAEATDQNFIEEPSEEEKEGRKRDTKCRKFIIAEDFRHDQVVPLYKLPLLGDVTQGHGSLKE